MYIALSCICNQSNWKFKPVKPDRPSYSNNNVSGVTCVQIMGAALRFFLSVEGGEEGEGEESESSGESGSEGRALRDIVLSRKTVKSGRKRERKVERAKRMLKVLGYI